MLVLLPTLLLAEEQIPTEQTLTIPTDDDFNLSHGFNNSLSDTTEAGTSAATEQKAGVLDTEIQHTPSDDSIVKSLSTVKETLNFTGAAIDKIMRPIDDFLSGTDSRLKGTGKTLLHVSTTSNFYQLSPYRQDYSYNLKLTLPKTESQMQLVVDNFVNELEGSDSGQDPRGSTESTTSSATSLGLQTILPFQKITKFKFSIGTNLSLNSNDMFVQTGIYIDKTINEVRRARLNHVYTGYDSIGWVSDSNLYLDFKSTPTLHFQSGTSIHWQRQSDDYSYSQQFSLFQKVNATRRYVYSVASRWLDKNNDGRASYLHSYYYQATWRERIYADWLYVSSTIGIIHADAEDFAENAYLKISFDAFSYGNHNF